MKRTVSLKLILTQDDVDALLETGKAFSAACTQIVPFVVENRCWNSVALHHLTYYSLRERLPSLGSQMICNAIKKVCSSYKALRITKVQDVPSILFRESGSIHYDKRTYSIKDGTLSLFAIGGRVRCPFRMGPHQEKYLLAGKPREGELIRKGKRWFFNLVVELPDVPLLDKGNVFAVDLGENNLATTSNGTIYGGGKLRDTRDKFLSRRRRLQSNGSQSARRRLRRIFRQGTSARQ